MWYSVNGLDLYYEDVGEGTPVVIIHGFTLDHRSMMNCLEPIFSVHEGWRRMYIDLPGHGKTKGIDWIRNSDDVLQVVIDFIDSVIPETHFLVIGLSYGGYVARGLVYRRMEMIDGLLLIVPRVVSRPDERDLPPRSVLEKDDVFLSKLSTAERDQFMEVPVIMSKEVLSRYAVDIVPATRIADDDFLKRLDNTVDAFSFDVDTLPNKFTRPSLFIVGRQDHIVGYRDAWKIIEDYPRATFAVLDRAGHGLQMEQVFLFNSLVGDWLARTLMG
jgi:pimeloyl-ACP methyl ester carboxylesterase